MPVESIQCPSCGAPLPLGRAARTAVCGYCHANLRITIGTSGHPLAALADIGMDTRILAAQAACRRLDERLAALMSERSLELRKYDVGDCARWNVEERLAVLAGGRERTKLALQASVQRIAALRAQSRRRISRGHVLAWALISAGALVVLALVPAVALLTGVRSAGAPCLLFPIALLGALIAIAGLTKLERAAVEQRRRTEQLKARLAGVEMAHAELERRLEEHQKQIAHLPACAKRIAELTRQIEAARSQIAGLKAQMDEPIDGL